MFIKRRG
ncbi:hypothetical protein GQ607_016879 [Colletotrichum asianum]|nr:hypothetical protein GQ607_016879 [Colletotrichum asianum]